MVKRKYRQNPAIADKLVEARELLLQGLSLRKVAEQTGLGRTTVRRHLQKTAELVTRQGRRRGRPMAFDAVSGEWRPTERCPDCGAMVLMPCRVCAIRRR